jgi:hypothetical protein
MSDIVFDDFTQTTLDKRWVTTCLGAGSLSLADSALRMTLPAITQHRLYCDAQIDDYGTLPRSQFPWQPPLRMTVRARSSLPAATPHTNASTGLQGTAGFGFWNYPFSVRGDILMLPEALWFFYASPPSNMALVPGIPGWGWKAQIIHAMRPEVLVATLPTALATGWGWLTHDTRPAARWLQRLSGAQEAVITTRMTDWHTYVLEWHTHEARFFVDDTLVLQGKNPPTRPLGFVAWLDNQYAVVTPRGIFRMGTITTQPQWFELDSVRIEKLTAHQYRLPKWATGY